MKSLGGEGGKDGESSSRRTGSVPTADEFGRAMSRISVAQLCESTGFQNIQRSALDAFSDVVLRYITDLGKAAQLYTNLSGRTECNIFDIIKALEDLASPSGFFGASDIDHFLVSSGVVREISHYVTTSEEVPFAQPVPRFPVARASSSLPSFEQIAETPPGSHIPSWLPAFPDPHTYIQTPVWHEKTSDPKSDKMEQVRQHRKAERSLLNLQQRLASRDRDAAVLMQRDEREVGKGKHIEASTSASAERNPFLAPPLPFGEKDVSQLVAPDETQITQSPKTFSVLETFAPAIEAMKSGALDVEVNDTKALPSKRPLIRFKFGIDKKTLAVPFPLGNKGLAEPSPLLLRDDGKDDKKRRAKLILRESMENPHELHQL